MRLANILNIIIIFFNIFFVSLILFKIIKFINTKFIYGKCFYNNMTNTICSADKIYYVVNCSFENHNHRKCLSYNYIEKDIDCYLCDIKDNIYYIENTYCGLAKFINDICSYIMIIFEINCIFYLFLKKIKKYNKKENIIKNLLYNKINIQSDDICTICLENFNNDIDIQNDFIIKTNCKPIGHYFCYTCAKIWFSKNKICPYCRQTVI